MYGDGARFDPSRSGWHLLFGTDDVELVMIYDHDTNSWKYEPVAFDEERLRSMLQNFAEQRAHTAKLGAPPKPFPVSKQHLIEKRVYWGWYDGGPNDLAREGSFYAMHYHDGSAVDLGDGVEVDVPAGIWVLIEWSKDAFDKIDEGLWMDLSPTTVWDYKATDGTKWEGDSIRYVGLVDEGALDSIGTARDYLPWDTFDTGDAEPRSGTSDGVSPRSARSAPELLQATTSIAMRARRRAELTMRSARQPVNAPGRLRAIRRIAHRDPVGDHDEPPTRSAEAPPFAPPNSNATADTTETQPAARSATHPDKERPMDPKNKQQQDPLKNTASGEQPQTRSAGEAPESASELEKLREENARLRAQVEAKPASSSASASEPSPEDPMAELAQVEAKRINSEIRSLISAGKLLLRDAETAAEKLRAGESIEELVDDYTTAALRTGSTTGSAEHRESTPDSSKPLGGEWTEDELDARAAEVMRSEGVSYRDAEQKVLAEIRAAGGSVKINRVA